jgi:ABC-type Zn2+ transport system substrate-binding protein/surface adhesin
MHSSFSIKGFAAVAALAVGLAAGPAMADIKVAATIKPIHSLVAAVMGDTGEPALLLDGPASPHVTALRPSQARIIENSDIVFAVGEGLEAFLRNVMAGDGGKRIVELAEAPGVKLLAYRDEGARTSTSAITIMGTDMPHSTTRMAPASMIMAPTIMGTATATLATTMAMSTAKTTPTCGSIRTMAGPWRATSPRS